jgi:gliding motility-associated-like protein
MDNSIRAFLWNLWGLPAKQARVLLTGAMALLFGMVVPSGAAAQIDTAFWFVAPNLDQAHDDRPVFMRLSTFGSPATITISQPANPYFPAQKISLSAYATSSVNLTPWIEFVENLPVNSVNNKGILVSSSAPISVYYDIASSFNGDMFSLKGRNALGQQFHVPFQNAWPNRNPSASGKDLTSSIEIVATEDGTTVTIHPSQAMVGHPAGTPFTVTLNRGQAYSCEAASPTGAAHLSGTLITSNKPIAVTTRDDSVFPNTGYCMDTAGDQLVPDRLAGVDFIVVKGYLDGPDNFYVLATEDATTVSIDSTEVAVLKEGESYRGTLSNPTAYIQTGKPAHVFHLSGFGCEVGGAIIPTIRCTGSQDASITRASSQYLALNILVPTAATGAFTFNGRAGLITADKFAPVPGTGGQWSYARISVSTADLPVGAVGSIKNSRGRFQLGLIHGDLNSTCRYGYFSDFAKNDIVLSYTPGPYCIGSSLTMTASNSSFTNLFNWTGPNGFTATTQDVTLTDLTPAASGYYVARTAGGCGNGIDSILVEVREQHAQDVEAVICAGHTYTLPSGRSVAVAGTYKDTVRYNSGCDSLVSVVQLSVKTVQTQTTPVAICAGESYITSWGLSATATGIYRDTLYYTTGCDSVIRVVELDVITAKEIRSEAAICSDDWYTLPWGGRVNTTGVYRDTIRSQGGCDSVITIASLRVDPAPVVRVTKSNDIDCLWESVQLTATGGGTYSWWPALSLSNAAISNPVANPATTTRYEVAVTAANGCTGEGSIEVYVTGSSPEKGYHVPNAFTPNGDGLNDCLGVPHWAGVNNLKLTVFNRWGEVVFQSSELSKCWDGRYKGRLQDPGVFAYFITADTDCGKVVRKGTIALVR